MDREDRTVLGLSPECCRRTRSGEHRAGCPTGSACCGKTEATRHADNCSNDLRVRQPADWEASRGEFIREFGLTNYRTCCSTMLGSPHWFGCGTNFFADGQWVIKPDLNPSSPWGPARLRIREDTVACDRTFENETRPL